MIIHSTPLDKAKIIEMRPIQDNRGHFARTFCKKTLAKHGIIFDMVQSNVAYNHKPRTTRGMHFQLPPFSEDKIISCIRGEIYDVIIDLNKTSPTFGKWFGLTLSDENNFSLYVPKGFAHGYQTMVENTSIHYLVSESYSPSYESGVRWNDKAFGIEWPFKDEIIISPKDEQWRDFDKNTDGIISLGGDDHE
ncbi:dTDP-4-dehydrorhamnose 3,5-epimerase [Metabacillus litoralis]|uniref:dTDP-4-dehydrorhamnose 3,5-epimerase n=1 Tax=Metabacillus litoralis TaxID=152268 RepID=UPI001B90B952|nr:dTDP-4-dehydrorhamnose 3,5-epimerase [Metabacillus litoralis]UHA61590.1 dTDP-4-dehydrorhamnose 3,5-epimerase [Metabacillus litoralis]